MDGSLAARLYGVPSGPRFEGVQASNKHLVFDINTIGNKLQSSQTLLAPSARAHEQLLNTKAKNQQSELIKIAL